MWDGVVVLMYEYTADIMAYIPPANNIGIAAVSIQYGAINNYKII